MNKLNEIISNNVFIDNKLYLLEKPADGFGFFFQNGIVYFGKESEIGTEAESIDTSYLDLNMNVYMESEEEEQSFKTGYYDLLSYKGDLDDLYFDVFYKICKSYCLDTKGISFYDFFNSIVEIFKRNKADIYKKLIGLIGELLFIKFIYEKYNKNIIDNWHLTGANSKFDFSFKNLNIEVKTTTKNDLVFKLKHSQIFNNQNNFVCVVSLIETGIGDTLSSLINYFENTPVFARNVKFQIALVNEYVKISSKDDKEKAFSLDNISCYSISNMPSITDIPAEISNIVYEYNFSDIEETLLEEILADE